MRRKQNLKIITFHYKKIIEMKFSQLFRKKEKKYHGFY